MEPLQKRRDQEVEGEGKERNGSKGNLKINTYYIHVPIPYKEFIIMYYKLVPIKNKGITFLKTLIIYFNL